MRQVLYTSALSVLKTTFHVRENIALVSRSADLAEVGAAREQFPDVGGGQLAVSADGVRQVAADLRVVWIV